LEEKKKILGSRSGPDPRSESKVSDGETTTDASYEDQQELIFNRSTREEPHRLYMAPVMTLELNLTAPTL